MNQKEETSESVAPAVAATGAGWSRANAVNLSSEAGGIGIGVDREHEVIRGYIVAQEGVFKDKRGEFGKDDLAAIVKFMEAAPNGLKSRLAHPDLSNDGVGKFLGRVKNPRLDIIGARESHGELKTDPITVVRGDLCIDPSSHKTPGGDIGEYVLTLAETDPDAFSSSLVLTVEQEYRVDARNVRLKDDSGKELPPLWHPTALHASDVVDTGDAVDGLLSSQLSADGLPDGVVRAASKLMDEQFAGKTREFVQSHCLSWLDRYLTRRYGSMESTTEPKGNTPEVAAAPEQRKVSPQTRWNLEDFASQK